MHRKISGNKRIILLQITLCRFTRKVNDELFRFEDITYVTVSYVEIHVSSYSDIQPRIIGSLIGNDHIKDVYSSKNLEYVTEA